MRQLASRFRTPSKANWARCGLMELSGQFLTDDFEFRGIKPTRSGGIDRPTNCSECTRSEWIGTGCAGFAAASGDLGSWTELKR